MAYLTYARLCFLLLFGLIALVFHVTAGNAIRAPGPDPTSTSKALSTSTDEFLATLWTPIPKKVNVGYVENFRYVDFSQNEFTTQEFYGCTIVIVIDGEQTLIGHFNQGSGNCADVLTNSAATEKWILTPMISKLIFADFQVGARAWILASTPNAKNAPGYKDLVNLLKENVDEADITLVPYQPSSGIGEFPGKARGKAVVTRDKNPDDTWTIKLYIEKNNPTWTKNYDSQCNPISRKRNGGACNLGRLGSNTTSLPSTGTVTTNPAGPTPSCEYVGPSPPENPEAQCVCDGTSNLPLTTLSSQLAPDSSCAWSTMPGTTSATDSAPLGPPTTDSKACQICTPYAVNGDDCSSITSCVKQVAQATVQAGSSPVHVGTLTSSALSSAIFSAIDQACPSVTGTSATVCQTAGVNIDHIDYKDPEGVINHFGTLNVQIQASWYNDSGIRKAMIDSAAATAMSGATGKNCYQDSPIMEHSKRSLFARALSYIPPSIVPNALIHRGFADPAPVTEQVTWCNTVSFAGVQYYGEFARLDNSLGPTDYLDVGWTFHEESGSAFDCAFIGDLIDALAILAPEFTAGDIALGDTIQATCETAVALAGGRSTVKRAAIGPGPSHWTHGDSGDVEGPRPRPWEFRA